MVVSAIHLTFNRVRDVSDATNDAAIAYALKRQRTYSDSSATMQTILGESDSAISEMGLSALERARGHSVLQHMDTQDMLVDEDFDENENYQDDFDDDQDGKY